MATAAIALAVLVVMALPAGTTAEQASQPGAPAAGHLDLSGGTRDDSGHTCARMSTGDVRCWGFGGTTDLVTPKGDGRLGYGNARTIGDDETPGSVGPVDLGAGRSADAVSAGSFHTCAVLDDSSVRCWGFGINGRLGYGNTLTIGDDETPAAAGPVDVGGEASSITTGNGHTCALLVDGSVRCWGYGDGGQLGYGNRNTIGDDEAPREAGSVDVGSARTLAISAGALHTCALLDGGSVRCWGDPGSGRLGYGNLDRIGDDETPGEVGPVELGGAATAISAGEIHTCALLAGGGVRCWGAGADGRLGYGNTTTIGDTEPPASVGPVDLGQAAKAVSAGDRHTCALLVDGSVRCWGAGDNGRLGYANSATIGDNEPAGAMGAVDLGVGRTAVAISAGGRHTCALLDDDSIRCWGFGALGRLGYCSTNDIGDDETPGAAGPVNVLGSSGCPLRGGTAPAPGAGSPPEAEDSQAERYRRALAAQARRKRALRTCLRRAARRFPRPTSAMRPGERRRASARRRAARRRCLRRFGRTPGRVGSLTARGVSRTKVVLSFRAPGTHGSRAPAARRYVVKQSPRPIRTKRAFRRAQTLCKGRCSFAVKLVGEKIDLTVTDLRPGTTYYYAVAARDNVSARVGPRSPTTSASTRP